MKRINTGGDEHAHLYQRVVKDAVVLGAALEKGICAFQHVPETVARVEPSGTPRFHRNALSNCFDFRNELAPRGGLVLRTVLNTRERVLHGVVHLGVILPLEWRDPHSVGAV